jgi:hypothetical protein
MFREDRMNILDDIWETKKEDSTFLDIELIVY